MARTDPPIKLKRSVLRRVITTKLEALRRGDFYVRNHLGPECYEPIVAEARSFLSPSGRAGDGSAPQDPSPSLSQDFDTFVQIIAASILIDASMRGENAGESDPRFIKKKKKMLAKTLKGAKFDEFTAIIWRFDCLKRGVEVPPEEESEEEKYSSEGSGSSEEDDHDDSGRDDTTSVTSHTSGDGFSTSASNSKRHHHGSGSSSKRKKHKKEKKKLKKEKKQRRREERRRRKEEKRLKKLAEKEKKKKKRKREEESEEEIFDEEHPPEHEMTNGSSDNIQDQDNESMYEIEHATKEEFEAFREEILGKIPNKVKRRFREGGFSRWGKDWLPVLEIGPFDVEPGPVRRMWMEMFHNTRQSGREMTRLVFWYGVKFEDRGQAYSFVPSSKIMPYEEGERAGHCDMPKKIQTKIDKRIKLTKTEEQIMRGLREIKADMVKEKSDRIQWMMHFQEDYEVAESIPEPEPEPELDHEKPKAVEVGDGVSGEMKIKRKPGRPKKSETIDGEIRKKSEPTDLDKPIKRKPGRPKKSESLASAADGIDAPIKRKPGRPKKSDADKTVVKEAREKLKAKSESKPKPKKFVIVDEDNDYQLDSDEDDDDKDYNGDSSDDSSMDESEDADDELSEKASLKRKAPCEIETPKKKSKSFLSEEEAAEYKEKKRREKAEALGLDYVPKKSKSKLFEEEQDRFSQCEDVFIPLIQQLRTAKDDHNVTSVLKTIQKLMEKVEMLTPPFLRSYPLGMLVREVRKSFESSEPEVKDQCKRLTNEMKRVYNLKEKNTPDEFVPTKRVEKVVSTENSDSIKKKIETVNDVSMADAVKTEDTTVEPPSIRSNADVPSYPDQSLRSTEVVATDPVKTDPIKTDPVKTEPTKPMKKTFSIKGMFEKPKPIPKPKVAPAVIVSGPVSPKPKSLPLWVTGPPLKGEEGFHEQHAKERNFALEFLTDAASTIPSNKVDPVSISQSLELAIFAETKLRGNDWNKYWEKVHDVVAMISPGKNQPNSITLGIARGDYQDPSQLVTLARREIHSLNQQRVKSLI